MEVKPNKFVDKKTVSKNILKKTPRVTYNLAATESEPVGYKSLFFK